MVIGDYAARVDGVPVVGEQCGGQTGDRIILTADGRVWRPVAASSDGDIVKTGETRAILETRSR